MYMIFMLCYIAYEVHTNRRLISNRIVANGETFFRSLLKSQLNYLQHDWYHFHGCLHPQCKLYTFPTNNIDRKFYFVRPPCAELCHNIWLYKSSFKRILLVQLLQSQQHSIQLRIPNRTVGTVNEVRLKMLIPSHRHYHFIQNRSKFTVIIIFLMDLCTSFFISFLSTSIAFYRIISADI